VLEENIVSLNENTMKTLSISGLILALASLGLWLYNQLVYVAAYHEHLCKTDPVSREMCMQAEDMKILLGQLVIIGGMIGLASCVFAAIKSKKNYPAYFGILFSLIAIVFGLMQATHMFDATGYIWK